MPYRAMFNALISVVLSLVMVTGWELAVQRQIDRASTAETQSTPKGDAWRAVVAAHDTAKLLGHPYSAILKVRSGVTILSLMLIGALFLVGFFATFREWIRARIAARPRKKARTKYVDAWKIAAERLNAPPPEGPDRPKT